MLKRLVGLALAMMFGLGVTSAADSDQFETRPHMLFPGYPPGTPVLGVRLLGAVEIVRARINTIPLLSLSGLAWDDDDGILYAVSDTGALFHLKPRFDDGILIDIEPIDAVWLRDRDAHPLRGDASDAEGLAGLGTRNGRRGDARLLVSFERMMRAVRYRTDGRIEATLALPPAIHRLPLRSQNRSLESITVLDDIGPLTAIESPLIGTRAATVPIVALDGQRWRYPLYPLPNPALVAMEALDDGSILTLERGYVWLFFSTATALRRIRAPWPPSGHKLTVDTLAVFRSEQGWSIDNFEGLTRHRAMKFFIVSDDNNRVNQKTLIVYFEVLDAPSRTELEAFEGIR